MNKSLLKYLPTILLAVVLSFCTDKNSQQQADKANIETTNITSLANLSFDFSVTTTPESNLGKEINGYIYNNNPDTVYFLNTSCEGAVYCLRYDTSKFQLTPTIFCNASYHCIDKIPPKRRYDFVARLRNKSKEAKIKLGFKFVEMGMNSDISKIDFRCSFNSTNINDKDILWSDDIK